MSPREVEKVKDEEKDKATKAPAKTVRVANRTRRPICFRILGRTIRLAPGRTSAKLGQHCSTAPELNALCAKGVLALIDVEPTDAPDSSKKGESRSRQQTRGPRQSREGSDPDKKATKRSEPKEK